MSTAFQGEAVLPLGPRGARLGFVYELLALGTDPERAETVADRLGAIVYTAHETAHPRAPFRAAVRAVTDDIEPVRDVAAVALHLIFARQIKARDVTWSLGSPTPGVVAAFGLRCRPDVGHRRADDHWRDVHAPLALEHHAAMWDYAQLSVVRTLHGPGLDGLALCAFPTYEDYSERFFNDAESERIISADVTTFADVSRSPRPVLLTEQLPARRPSVR